MKNMILALSIVISFFTMANKPFEPDGQQSSGFERELTEYTNWFFRNVKPKYKREAQKIIPHVVEISLDKNLDPLLTAVIISRESTWKPTAVGGIGEKGVMQTHGLASRGFDVKTVEGQLRAGVSWLARSIEKCGSIEGGLAFYQTGNTCKPIRQSKKRYDIYLDAVERFRR